MRKWNAILTAAILVLFLVHLIAGVFVLTGVMRGGTVILRLVARVVVVLLVVHTLIGIYLTITSLRSIKRAGVSYPKENRLFWARRISGFAVFLLVFSHMAIFLGEGDGAAYRLHFFGAYELELQICMVIAIAVHVISNVNPLLIGLGLKKGKEYANDILFVLSVLLLLGGVAFVIYFLRWSVI